MEYGVYMDKTDIIEMKDLLRRWNKVDIPAEIWAETGADYDLPLETASFLEYLKETEEIGF